MSLINITLHIVVTTGGPTSGKLRHVLKESEEAYHLLFIKGLVKLCETVCGLLSC